MKTAVLVLAVGGMLGTLALAGAPAQDVQDDPVYAKSVGWLKGNFKFGPDEKLVRVIADRIGATVADGRSFQCVLGAGLTKSGKATLVQAWAGRVYVFPLTDAEAAKLGIESESAKFSSGTPHQGERAADPSAKVNFLAIDAARNLDATAAITGQVSFESLKDLPKNVAVRISYQAGGTTTSSFSYPKTLPGDKGVLKFSFPAMAKDEIDREKISGPVAVFVDLVSVEQTAGDVKVIILSNTIGTVVDAE